MFQARLPLYAAINHNEPSGRRLRATRVRVGLVFWASLMLLFKSKGWYRVMPLRAVESTSTKVLASAATEVHVAMNKMDDAMRQEWTRHYDIIQWQVITIFTAGVGGLFVYAFNDDKHQLWPEFIGMLLTVLGVFYVASFRRFRFNLHNNINNLELNTFLKDPDYDRSKYLHQWNAFWLSFFIIDWFFTYKLWRNASYLRFDFGLRGRFLLIFSVLLFIVSVLSALCFFWTWGRSNVRRRRIQVPLS